MIAANIDVAFIVQSCHFDFNVRRLERMLANICAIRKAIESGELNPEHCQSYLKLKAESEFNEMSYVDKRKKEKTFGKMVKTVLKQKKCRTRRGFSIAYAETLVSTRSTVKR